MEMYFLAMVAPPSVNDQILKWKNMMKEKFGCVVALRSPAHITLVPPFWMDEKLEEELIKSLDQFRSQNMPLEIKLGDFSAFKPRVIFVAVMKNESLKSVQEELEDHLINKNLFPIEKENRDFHPHVTIANRDLHKKSFHEAWEIFGRKKYEASWIADGVSLLKLNKKNWDVIHTSQPK